jgi:glycosyltransferase involved in cell wall biosynthesis
MSLTVGLFTDTYLPQINGVTTLMPIMDRLLTQMGHRVYIFAPSYDRPRWSRESEFIFRFPAFKFAFHKDSRISIPFHGEARAVFQQLDIVHSQTPFSLGVLGIHLSRKYQIPHLHTYHTLFTEYLHYIPRYLRPSPKLVGKISLAFCNRCDAVTVPSNPMRDELTSYGISVPVYTLPFGLDMDDFTREIKVDLRAKLNIPTTEKILLCTGRLSREKNISFVLKAFQRVVQEMPNTRLIIVGDGPARSELEHETADLGLGERAIFTGFVPWRDLIDYYRQADLFVYASKTETQGIVFMEAMASGLPVVTIGAMGALEAVRHDVTGLLVEEDTEAYAGAVLELLRNGMHHNELSRNSIRVSEETSIQRSLTQLIEIYNELIEARTLIHQA